jgi:CrcB protein
VLVAYFLVGIAGIIGALLRYLVGIYFNHWWFYDFPLATLLTNLSGCFLLGWLTKFLPKLKFLHPNFKTALGTGLIGSFTTFSTFSVETVKLIEAAMWASAFLYVLLSLTGGLLFSWLGYKTGQKKKKMAGVV